MSECELVVLAILVVITSVCCVYRRIEKPFVGVYCTHQRMLDSLMRSREVIDLMLADGWFEVGVKGSHHQFKHPIKSGRVTVPHPKSEIAKGTLHGILKSAGLK